MENHRKLFILTGNTEKSFTHTHTHHLTYISCGMCAATQTTLTSQQHPLENSQKKLPLFARRRAHLHCLHSHQAHQKNIFFQSRYKNDAFFFKPTKDLKFKNPIDWEKKKYTSRRKWNQNRQVNNRNVQKHSKWNKKILQCAKGMKQFL